MSCGVRSWDLRHYPLHVFRHWDLEELTMAWWGFEQVNIKTWMICSVWKKKKQKTHGCHHELEKTLKKIAGFQPMENGWARAHAKTTPICWFLCHQLSYVANHKPFINFHKNKWRVKFAINSLFWDDLKKFGKVSYMFESNLAFRHDPRFPPSTQPRYFFLITWLNTFEMQLWVVPSRFPP